MARKIEREVQAALKDEPEEITFRVTARWWSRPGQRVARAGELFSAHGYRMTRIVAGPGVWFATFERRGGA